MKKRNPNTPKQPVYKKYCVGGVCVTVMISKSEEYTEDPVYLHMYSQENEILECDHGYTREQFKRLIDHLQQAYDEAYA